MALAESNIYPEEEADSELDAIDLQDLAEMIAALLLRELEIEKERLGN